jgi:hypothetical protein
MFKLIGIHDSMPAFTWHLTGQFKTCAAALEVFKPHNTVTEHADSILGSASLMTVPSAGNASENCESTGTAHVKGPVLMACLWE